MIRRDGPPSSPDATYSLYALSEVKVYGMTNLLEYQASIIEAPEPVDS